METQEWWKVDFEKKHWGAMFECGDYEALLDDVSAIIAKAIRRRDAEILEKVEGVKKDTDCKSGGECNTCGAMEMSLR